MRLGVLSFGILSLGLLLGCKQPGEVSPDKDLVTFSIQSPAVVGDIVDHTISVLLPSGTNVTTLVAEFTTTGAVVTVGGKLQTSGVTPNDFSHAVEYRVTARDGTSAKYTVTVSLAPSTDNDIHAYSFGNDSIAGVIDDTTIQVVANYDSDLANLVAIFTFYGTSITVDGVEQTSGMDSHDFSDPVIYHVVAEDGSFKDYTVTVTQAQDPRNTLDTFTLQTAGVGTINVSTITVDVPIGVDLSLLTANFVTTSSLASVKVGSTTQNPSGGTYNDYRSPVEFVVTAADGATKTYTVTARYVVTASTMATGFSGPKGLVADTGGNVYVADTNNNLIKKVAADGTVTTLAGSGTSAETDGTGIAAAFASPSFIALSSDNLSLWVLDVDFTVKVRKILLSSGAVSTVAITGLSGDYQGLAADATTLYFAHNFGKTIQKVALAGGTASVLAGTSGTAGGVDATGTSASFYGPSGLTLDGAGNLYVLDSDNLNINNVRKIEISTGNVSTLPNSSFYKPKGIVYDAGKLYVADTFNHSVKLVNVTTGSVSLVAGNIASSGNSNGSGLGSSVRFNHPFGIAIDPTSHSLYITDYSNNSVRKLE